MNPARYYRDSTPSHSSNSAGAGCNGVCIMSTAWKDEHPSFINFISSFLDTNSFRLNFVSIDPDFIFNCGGVSVAFIFTTSWDSGISQSIFSKIQKLKEQFAHFYVVVTLPTKDQNDFFIRSYFKHGMEFGRPTFIPVQDLEMGFEKIVKIAHARGGEVAYGDSVVQKNLEVFINHRHFIAVCKRHDAIAKLKAEREKSAQSMDVYIKVVTSIPGIDSHDAIALNQAIGSIEAIAKASKEYILENTDLSTEKAETITRFFRDPKFYLGTKLK